MTEQQVIKTILTAVEENFPKDCTCCGHSFSTYKQYLKETYPLGSPLSNDAAIGNWQPQKPLGFLAYWKCKLCSNTLTTNINSLENDTVWQLLSWIKEETTIRKISSTELLNDIRGKIRKMVLGT